MNKDMNVLRPVYLQNKNIDIIFIDNLSLRGNNQEVYLDE